MASPPTKNLMEKERYKTHSGKLLHRPAIQRTCLPIHPISNPNLPTLVPNTCNARRCLGSEECELSYASVTQTTVVSYPQDLVVLCSYELYHKWIASEDSGKTLSARLSAPVIICRTLRCHPIRFAITTSLRRRLASCISPGSTLSASKTPSLIKA